jgi:DGQHR domain-containing protein
MSKHIIDKKPVPGAIIVCFDKANYDHKNAKLLIPAGSDVGWVIDGQHRLAGAETAARAGVEIELSVVAFIGLSQPQQIEQFITINREAKNVPTSLYLDLLGKLPHRNPADSARERAVDLANRLRKDEESPFYSRVSVTIAPKPGQLSLTNFVRKIIPLVVQDKGMLGVYTELEQYKVIDNFYSAIHQTFPSEFDSKSSIFFKTLGFGALWNVFPTVFGLCLKYQQGFEVKDVLAILKPIENFDFSGWKQYGTGNQAEVNAADDLRVALDLSLAGNNLKGTLRV